MLRMFSFLPPVGCYILAGIVLVATYGVQQGLAGAEGLEPPTYGFGDRRSTN